MIHDPVGCASGEAGGTGEAWAGCSLLRFNDVVAATTLLGTLLTDSSHEVTPPEFGVIGRGRVRHGPREDDRAGKSVRFVFRRRPVRRGGALAQWQSSGLLTHWFRVRPPGAPPGKTGFWEVVPWTDSWTEWTDRRSGAERILRR